MLGCLRGMIMSKVAANISIREPPDFVDKATKISLRNAS